MHPNFVAECTPTWNFVLKQTLTYTSLYILATDKSTNNLKYFENLCHEITRLKSFLSRFIFSGGYFIILILKNEIWPSSVPNSHIYFNGTILTINVILSPAFIPKTSFTSSTISAPTISKAISLPKTISEHCNRLDGCTPLFINCINYYCFFLFIVYNTFNI